MRPFYLLLRFLLPYVMVVFFRKRKSINSQRKFNAQTIFVCNHPSAFIDPLVAGNFQMPVLYFATRGDIFTKALHPITWASHMVPIFRKAQDGANSHEKNKDSFKYLKRVLMRKKSLILFAEGYTDDTFIRSLKPVKKGPARIGFEAMVDSNWETDIKVQAIGINYSHPKKFRSDVLVAFSDCISLKDYKSLYEKNPNTAINQLTKDIQEAMQQQITYVDNKELAPFVEQIAILSRKGMNHENHDTSLPLIDRYNYSQKLALRVNDEYNETDQKWKEIKSKVTNYFDLLKSKNTEESVVFNYTNQKETSFSWLIFVLTLPLTILGLIHQFIPYLIIKRFVEKKFKRPVFWSGVKLLVGAVISVIYNFSFIYLFYYFVYPNYWLAVLYFLTIPSFSGIIAYIQIKNLKNLKTYKSSDKTVLSELAKERKQVIDLLKANNLV